MTTPTPSDGSRRTRPPGALRGVLVANRGEIACRVIRTARAMGLRTVAVYSTVDAGARHVVLADEAIELPGATARETYLCIERLVAAARLAGVDAIHPGYGFLSENPNFVDACEAAGLVFVGPPATAMRAMGLKDAAKVRMAAAGVPVVPGYHGAAQDTATLSAEAARIGYPVLVKARAGGGGKGMRRVDEAAAFEAALAAAQREARASFGDDAVLIERYVSAPRHVEVQVFGDTHGNVVHLFERECSLQRRHQKVIEEAPAPGIDTATRQAMTDAAVRAARAVGYVGAGTVEFIADGREGLRPDGFWFMEMNTRLQVEHPVTEAVTGLDLVEWQLRVAAGEPLPLGQDAIELRGHAIEARLYAEDPAAGFLPATGRLRRLAFGVTPGDAAGERDGLRVDTGVRQGDVVSPHYDPLLAKLVARAPDRAQALARLERLLRETVVLGTVTNRDFLLALCRHADVRAARLDTDLIGRELDALLRATRGGADGSAPDEDAPDEDARVARALVAVARVGVATAEPQALAARLGLWALWGEPCRAVSVADESGDVTLVVTRTGADDWTVRDERGALALTLDPVALVAGLARVVVAGRAREAEVLLEPDAGRAELRLGERVHRVRWAVAGVAPDVRDAGDALIAPMPGRVIAVSGEPGGAVRAGQSLLTLEAMKMEHSLDAPRDGVIESVAVAVGDQVAQGDELARLAPASDAGAETDSGRA